MRLDESGNHMEIRVCREVADKHDFIADAAACTTEKPVRISGQQNLSGTNFEHRHAHGNTGFFDTHVGCDNRFFIDTDNIALGVPLRNGKAKQGLFHVLSSLPCGRKELRRGIFQIMYEIASRAACIVQDVCGIGRAESQRVSPKDRSLIINAELAQEEIRMIGDGLCDRCKRLCEADFKTLLLEIFN